MISEHCIQCIYRKQEQLTDNQEYLKKIREIIDNRDNEDTAPYMSYKFDLVHKAFFGTKRDYSDIKKHYNELVMAVEDRIEEDLAKSEDPLKTSLMLCRTGNYIDFGTVHDVNDDTFMELMSKTKLSEWDERTYAAFVKQCDKAKTFLLICDNCGEVVLDKIMLKQLKKRFPKLEINIMVRGGEASNDATLEDAHFTGIDKLGRMYTNGFDLAGIRWDRLPEETREIMNTADVILAKGQANYECMTGFERNRFHMFLCKCDLFTNKFNVPRLTGMFIEEN